MFEKCRDNKYFLINLDTEVRNNDSITKIWLCKVMSEKRGWQVTKSPPLNPSLLVAHKKYLPIIATIKKGLLNKKLLLSTIVVLRQNFLNTLIKITILGKIYQCISCYAKLEQHWIECMCSQQPYYPPFWPQKNWSSPSQWVFTKIP